MTPSSSITAFIKGFEACRLKAYMPTPNDVPTIGYGHTAGVHMGDIWTQAQADNVFAADLAMFGRDVWAAIGIAKTTQGQFDSMVSLAFNIGIGAFKTSSVLTNHIAGHYQTAQWAFSLWNKQRGSDGQLHVLPGLTKRRATEAAIYGGNL